MYDIICDIWKNPGAAFTAMPMWVWNVMPDEDGIKTQINEFHKKGIDGFVIKIGDEISENYFTEEYFSCVKAALDAAKKRFMQVIIADGRELTSGAHGEYIKSEKRIGARRLYTVPAESEIPADEVLLFRLFVKLENGLLTDVALSPADGYVGYDFIMGYADDADADVFNPTYADSLLAATYEEYYSRFGEYFGQTLIGFISDCGSVGGKNYIPWTYGLEEEFFEAGGEFMSLVALFFEPKIKKNRREGEFVLSRILRNRIASAYAKPIADWCSAHKVGLFGYSSDVTNGELFGITHFPGQYIGGGHTRKPLTDDESAAVKFASDSARHKGQSRSFALCFDKCGQEGNLWNFTPDNMLRNINYAVARGANMLIPCSFYYSPEVAAKNETLTPDVGMGNIWWGDYKKIAGYMKRMSWLGSTGTNNPTAAVLCSPDYVPAVPVNPLMEQGYTFNYLTVDDFLNRAHIHDGEIHIDRYKYSLILVGGRLRLTPEIVLKIGKFITGGGIMFRGSDFIGSVKKHTKRTSYFDGEGRENLRFVEYTKSGCTFFMMVNEGKSEICGKLITDKGCAAADFDPFTGKITPISGEMVDSGFAYAVTVPANGVKVIGMNPGELPTLAENRKQELSEIIALTEGRMTFECSPAENKTAKLSFTEVRDIADVKVNGQDATRLIFRPYEADITPLLIEGENTVEVAVTESAANKYGKPVPGGFAGCTVRILHNK